MNINFSIFTTVAKFEKINHVKISSFTVYRGYKVKNICNQNIIYQASTK